MKILITGGAGFIGSAVVRQVLKHSDDVIVVDKLTYAGNEATLADCSTSPGYSFAPVDICDREALETVFDRHRPDAVMHLAAESHVDRSIAGPGAFIQTNIVGSFQLLEVSREYYAGLDAAARESFRFHHVSTDEVFGDLPPDAAPFDESAAYAPSSPYAASKAGSDHLVRAWARTYGLPVLITNTSNNFGPYQYPEKLIPLCIQNALRGQPLPVYGRGEQVRDWIYVDDHAAALYDVLRKAAPGTTYNIGARQERRNIEVVEQICRLLDELAPQRPGGIKRYADLIQYVTDRPGHDARYAIDNSHFRAELGWSPAETFESGLRKTVSWYLDNGNWCAEMLDRGPAAATRGSVRAVT